MKIEFDTDINDYQEARKFKSLIVRMLKQESLDASLTSFASSINQQLEEFLARPEFAEYSQDDTDDLYISSHEQGLFGTLRQFFGPSKRELDLSRQRQQQISRAERAETSAFEALSETAEIGRERDELKAKVEQLEAALKEVEESP